MIDIKTQLIAEIVELLEITPDEVAKINAEFKKVVSENINTTADMISACKVYDPASFLAGAMISTSVLDTLRDVYTLKIAEQNRLEGNFRDVI